MKISELAEKLGSIATVGSHLHTAFTLFGALKGGAESPPEGASSTVKGLYGVLGFRDEHEFAILLEQLENKKPGSRDLILDFLAWHFRATTPSERALTWWHGNAFRHFLTQFNSNLGREIGTEEVVSASKRDDGTTATVTKKYKMYERTNHALDFLEWMVETIESETSRTAGYKKLIKRFETLRVPHLPRGAKAQAQKIDYAMGGLKRAAGAIDVRATEIRRERAARKSLLDRIIDWDF